MKTVDTAAITTTAHFNNSDLTFKASIYTAFLCMLFGANSVAIKISLFGLGIFTNVGIRFALASIALIIWAKMVGEPLGFNKKQGYKLLILSLIFTFQLSFFYYGLNKTTASHGTLIANLLPFVVLILAHFFIPGDQMTTKKVTGIALGFIGVLFLFFDSAPDVISGQMQTGDMIVSLAVFLWGCSAVYTKRIISEISVLQITLYPMVFGVPLFFLAGFLFDGQMVKFVDSKIIQAIIYQSFVTASYGFIAWNRLLYKFGATAIHSFVFIMPVSGVFLSVMILDEPLTLNIIVSIIFIIAGMFVVNRHGANS
ncbi:MAG: DMT family transporter [Desulfamplus sp.]|nr:DMT family transporter [Desulfamplus sp.]